MIKALPGGNVKWECVMLPGTGQQYNTLQVLWRVAEEATQHWSCKDLMSASGAHWKRQKP